MKTDVQYWKTRSKPLKIRTYDEVRIQTLEIFKIIKGDSKRKLHIRSKYFNNQKIFFDFFWEHLFQKPIAQRKVRLRYIHCGIELMEQTPYTPTIRLNPNNRDEELFRFYGVTSSNQHFCVQVKKNKQDELQFMSVFPK